MESLKDLSDRAPQGEWTLEEMPNDAGSRSNEFTSFGIEAEGKTLLDTLNATGTYLEREPDGDGGYTVWDAQGKAVIEYVLALVRAHRSGQLHDATALAEARAEGRRQGLEKAAEVANDTDVRRQDLSSYIRSLATTTPETLKPETGERDHG